MYPTEAMLKEPEEPKVGISRRFIDKWRSMQKQLEATKNPDYFLRNTLLKSVHILAIQRTLGYLIPRSSKQEIQQIANKFPTSQYPQDQIWYVTYEIQTTRNGNVFPREKTFIERKYPR